jgi:sugar-specific transcriptional regulator TrmB
MEIENEQLRLKNKELEEEIIKLKEHLKKYTSPARNKNYYENHKEEIIKKVKENKEKTNYSYVIPSDKKKEYNKTAYLKRKEKKENEAGNI